GSSAPASAASSGPTASTSSSTPSRCGSARSRSSRPGPVGRSARLRDRRGCSTLGGPSRTRPLVHAVRSRSLLVPVLAGALLLTACGDGDDAATDTATDGATEAPTAEATDGTA